MLKNRIITSVLIALCFVSCDTGEPEDNNRMEIPEDLITKPIWIDGAAGYGEGKYLYPWRGEHVMLLSYSKDLDKGAMQKWVGWCDEIYEFYYDCTGYIPGGGIEGLLHICQYRGTGAAAVGILGSCGINMEVEYFDGAYQAVLEGYCWGLNAYEMGRNFWDWAYFSKLGDEPWATGYAVYFQTAALEAKNIPDKNEETRDAYTEYMNDPGARFDNTLGQELGIGGWSSQSLFASFCLKLMDTFGDKWTYNVWKQVKARPDKTTEQDGPDNFVIASSIAAGYDLSSLFEYWKWTVSDNAKEIIKGYNYPVFNPSEL